jgi:transposase
MELYAGIDLHSNNSVVSVLDEQDRTVFAKRLPNDLASIVDVLKSCAGTLRGVAVESTYNWYWLVDGLQDAGFDVQLVNTAAVKQYDGLKYSGDFSDARHLAHLMRLGILPTGYIYPREERAVRDLLRKRGQLVRQRSAQILSMSNLVARDLGAHASGNEIKRWQPRRSTRCRCWPSRSWQLRLALDGDLETEDRPQGSQSRRVGADRAPKEAVAHRLNSAGRRPSRTT